MRFEHELEIERPPEDVYAFLSDPAKLPEWQGGVEEVAVLGERRFREVRTFMGRRAASEVEVTAAEPPREFAIRVVSGPVRVAARHALARVGPGRTRLRVEVEADPGSIPRLAAGVAARAARRQSEKDFRRLKEILEAR